MTNSREIRVNDETRIDITVRDENNMPIDLSQAVAITLKVRKPDGSVVDRPVTFITNGEDGAISYQMTPGELDQKGIWRLQVYLELGSGVRRSTIIPFEVYPNLD